MPHPTIPGLFSPAPKSRRRGRVGARKPKKIGIDDEPLEDELRKKQKSVQVRLRLRLWVAVAKFA